jgi:hypothetical protein
MFGVELATGNRIVYCTRHGSLMELIPATVLKVETHSALVQPYPFGLEEAATVKVNLKTPRYIAIVPGVADRS